MPEPQLTDREITSQDIQNLTSADNVAAFFDHLGYPVEDRVEMTTEALDLSDDLKESILNIEKISSVDGELEVYLVEMLSVTVARRKALARSFRDFPMEFLFVLTDDYKRIDFMLLERKVPAHKDFGIGKRKALIHHHTFTVDRTNPGQIAKRVLRRFSFTAYDQQGERDPLGQYDKLKSAFTTARWSEPYFNNRALFSDYYLTERVPEHPSWDVEDRNQIFRAIRSVYANAGNLSGKDHLSLQRELIIPVLEEIGFAVEEVESPEGPDLKLFPDDNPSGKQLAFSLCYPWNRYLDGRDAGGTDPEREEENPGAVMVGLLEEGRASWGILTNGKIWRLYSAEAHSRATNYYEIDLEEALASASPGKAFRYFYLFFRVYAFIPEEHSIAGETRELSFLDLILEESDLYARQLGDRLKDTVFEEVFPYFAEGLIEGIGGTEALLELPDDEREEKLELVYRGTLTFLYRLLFLLYAESRNLLPVREVRGYYRNSLQRIKEEIAERAGDIEDLAPENIRKAYGKEDTGLYDRFSELCRIVDKGSPAKNVPEYNGGLFLTDSERAHSQRDKEISSFLIDNPIPDQFFALGLDKMARDIDPKRHALGFIDYKSLGVRQLGSIYEGLLEFKVRVAVEKLAVVEGKQTEEIVPYREAKEEGLDILTEGRGQNAKERVIPRGEVYLVNNKRERKATGSYYTPDYIVKYIVENAVGPVLDEKLEELQPRLQETEQKYRALLKRKREVEGVDPDPYRLLKVNFGEIILDIFDIKVLDPAMGSGHFLVEAVDYITDRLVRFLDRYPFLSVFFEGMKETILNELSDQGVAADPELLTDVNLLKRHVLKRCIYGVDLTPMAVELAKVSLWLDCFTLGAPLSFLDHHLKCGNSLIGAMARELDEEEDRQMTFLTGPFAGLLRAAEIMRGVSLLTDVTLSQVRESGELYREYEEKAKPFKELLDIYVSQHFGLELASEFLTVHDQDQALQMIKGETDTPDVYEDVVERAQNLNDRMQFFHWDLEFPEVFIDLEATTWKNESGFDAIIGNPPYRTQALGKGQKSIEEKVLDYYRKMFPKASEYKVNTYTMFLARSLNVLNEYSILGMILPKTLLTNHYFKKLRKVLLSEYTINCLVGIDSKVFEDAEIGGNIIPIISKSPPSSNKVNIYECQKDKGFEQQGYVDQVTYLGLPDSAILLDMSWMGIFEKLDIYCDRLGNLANFYNGIKTGDNKRYLSDERKTNKHKMVLRGRDIDRYHHKWGGIYVYFDPEKLWSNTNRDMFETNPKIIMRQTGDRLTASLDNDSYYTMDTTHLVLPKEYSAYYYLVCINSGLLNWFYRQLIPEEGRVFAEVKIVNLKKMPIRKIYFTNPKEKVKKITNNLIELFDSGKSLEVINKVASLLSINSNDYKQVFHENTSKKSDNSDIVHDFLVYLGKWMIENKNIKNAIVKNFWDDLNSEIATSYYEELRNHGKWEKSLAKDLACEGYVDPDSRSTKHLDESLDWDEEAFKAFAGMLIGKTNVTPAMIEVYRKHAPEYQELSSRIDETDNLIDQIVYRLYGLTEEEIEIVERSFD